MIIFERDVKENVYEEGESAECEDVARRAQEAALIAESKRLKAQFRTELAQRREEWKREEQKEREMAADYRMRQAIREGREAAQARAVEDREQALKKTGEAVSGYLQEKGRTAEKLGANVPSVPKIASGTDSLYQKVDALLKQRKQGPVSVDTAPKPVGQMRQYLAYDPSKYGNAEEAAQFTRNLIPVVDVRKATKEEVDYLNRALVDYINHARLYGYAPTMPQQLEFSDEKTKILEAKNPGMKYQAVFAANKNLNRTTSYKGNETLFLGKMEIVPGFNQRTLEQDSRQAKACGDASTASKYHRFNHEMGHNQHWSIYPDSFLHPDKKLMGGADESYIYNHVSHYPRQYWGKDYTTYIREVFAEIWAMVVNGDALDAGVQEIFERIKANRPE